MTIKSALWIAFLAGMLVAAALGTRYGIGLPSVKKEAVSAREGSTHGRSHRRSGRFFLYRSGK
ncbi:MAG: hypothetical protein COB53_06435 [Elusimicrobia bacterium]|nr:MAG: hypothetical protein COB53_06435 [Elusimicrobiota bacterium]